MRGWMEQSPESSRVTLGGTWLQNALQPLPLEVLTWSGTRPRSGHAGGAFSLLTPRPGFKAYSRALFIVYT